MKISDYAWLVIGLLLLGSVGILTSLSVVLIARSYLGRPYGLGAGHPSYPQYPDPPYIDCGLLIKKVVKRAYNRTISRTITEQVEEAPYTKDVKMLSREALRGLLKDGIFVAFDWDMSTYRFDHGGIVSQGGSHIIHATSRPSARKVVEDPLEHFDGGWRTLYAWKEGLL